VLAQFYRWVDEQGTAHFAEGIDNVPQRYRSGGRALNLRNRPAPAPETTSAATRGRPALRPRSASSRPPHHRGLRASTPGPTVKLILDNRRGRHVDQPARARRVGRLAHARHARRALARDRQGRRGRGDAGRDRSLEVGGARVGRMVVASYDMDMSEVEGLLGQDFLAQFNVTIDSNEGVVKLVKK
jgi:hypothetical protein